MEKIYNWENKSIVIAEDLDMNFRLLELTLKKTKINILRAKNGKEAVNFVHEKLNGTKQIDAILMDIQMPEMSGLEATISIKKIFPQLPIIAQTAYALSDEKEKSFEAGCDDYISKPINRLELLSKLEKYLKE